MARYRGIFAIAVISMLMIVGCEAATEEARENTLDEILSRGHLICGIKADTPGFGVLNPDGTAQGNDVEYCHAMAAAVFGDRNKVEFKEATSANRFELLAAKEIDVLIRTTTWTASRDADLKVAFAPTTFYDGAGIMVKAGAGTVERDRARRGHHLHPGRHQHARRCL